MKSSIRDQGKHAFASTLKSLPVAKSGKAGKADKADKGKFYSLPALA